MRLQWERRRQGMYRGSADGFVLAQVAQVIGPGASDRGWMVWLFSSQAELPERYATDELAMAAAEAAIDAASGQT